MHVFSNVQLLASLLLVANVLDVVTGIIKAVDCKTVSSKAMKHGAWSKIMIWAIVFVSGIASTYLNMDLVTYVIGYYLIMELISILENASQFVPLPEKLKSILNQNKEEEK
jgi:toxin secretion/phage lysis holin